MERDVSHFLGDNRSYPIELSPSMQRSAGLGQGVPHMPVGGLLEGVAGGQDTPASSKLRPTI